MEVKRIDKFNYDYESKGGFTKLSEMMAEFKTQKEIAEHFGVCKESVRRWCKEFYDTTHDLRAMRRENRVNIILEFMKNHTLHESKQAFKKENRDYFREALFLAYKQGIYSNGKQNN